MSRKLIALGTTATLLGTVAHAEVPNVVADIAPVHSLVARVMEGVGTPDLIIPPGASLRYEVELVSVLNRTPQIARVDHE